MITTEKRGARTFVVNAMSLNLFDDCMFGLQSFDLRVELGPFFGSITDETEFEFSPEENYERESRQ